jgi:hypothetical protein
MSLQYDNELCYVSQCNVLGQVTSSKLQLRWQVRQVRMVDVSSSNYN